jgi:hypothetical protein
MSDNGNGNGNGHGANVSVRLAKLLAHHEGIAAAIRTTMELLADTRTGAKQKTAGAVINQAIALDATRRQTTATTRKKTGRAYNGGGARSAARIKASRRQQAKYLATFSPTVPKLKIGQRSAVLIRHGYLVKRGDGYVRSDKVFTP